MAYDPWITIKKFFIGLFTTLIPVILAYAIEWFQGTECPVELLPYVPLIVGFLFAFQNWWKHRKD